VAASHSDMQKIQIIGFFFENRLQWQYEVRLLLFTICRVRLKRDGTRAETRLRLSPKRTSPFKSAGASVQSTTGR